MDKPVAESCLRNQHAIYEALLKEFGSVSAKVLELGSGTGQHAAYITERISNIVWQPSDLRGFLGGIDSWRNSVQSGGMLEAIELDVDIGFPSSLERVFDYVFSANTIHFVSEKTATNILSAVSLGLKAGGRAYLYGPFNENGQYTSEGNVMLDDWLKSRDPSSGIKDRQWVCAQAETAGLQYVDRIPMPANNWMLVLKKK